MNIINRIGLNIVPCGTPKRIMCLVLNTEFISAYRSRSVGPTALSKTQFTIILFQEEKSFLSFICFICYISTIGTVIIRNCCNYS